MADVPVIFQARRTLARPCPKAYEPDDAAASDRDVKRIAGGRFSEASFETRTAVLRWRTGSSGRGAKGSSQSAAVVPGRELGDSNGIPAVGRGPFRRAGNRS